MKTITDMMNLKEKILQVLEMKKFTYADLASYLSISESELDYALENNTLEIRTLELISKELRPAFMVEINKDYARVREQNKNAQSQNKFQSYGYCHLDHWQHQDQLQ